MATMAHTAVAAFITALFLICPVAKGTPGNPVRPDYRWANAEAVEKWHDMKVGVAQSNTAAFALR
eukprot:SAG31_NODE_382_length_16456_cov_5.532983_6_plen_65_part_00